MYMTMQEKRRGNKYVLKKFDIAAFVLNPNKFMQ